MSSPAGGGARPPIWSRRWWLGGRERSEGSWRVNGPEQRDGTRIGEEVREQKLVRSGGALKRRERALGGSSVRWRTAGVERWMEQRRLCAGVPCPLSLDKRETRRESLRLPGGDNAMRA